MKRMRCVQTATGDPSFAQLSLKLFDGLLRPGECHCSARTTHAFVPIDSERKTEEGLDSAHPPVGGTVDDVLFFLEIELDGAVAHT